MDRSKYRYVSAHANDLDDTLRDLSEKRADIVAVSQSGNFYTIFYKCCEMEYGCVPMADLYDEEGKDVL